MGRRLQTLVAGTAIALAVLVGFLLSTRGQGESARVAAPHSVAAESGVESAELAPAAGDDEDAASEIVEAPSERRDARVRPDGSLRLHGRVVDARTGQGLPGVQITPAIEPDAAVVRLAPMDTDAEGRFTSTGAMAAGPVSLSAVDRLTSEELGLLEHEHAHLPVGAGAAELHWPVDVGPTLVVDLLGDPAGEGPWRLRLVERSDAGGRLEWSWLEARPDVLAGRLLARYAHVEHEPGAGRLAWVEATDARGRLAGEVSVPTTLGVHELELAVTSRAASLSGRVLDEDGFPVDAAVVALARSDVQPSTEGWARPSRTDEAGRYRIDGLRPGPVQLLVASDHRALARADLVLAAGEEREQDVTLASLRIAGDVRGELLGPPGGDEPVAILRLVSLDSGAADLVQFCLEEHVFDSSAADERSPFAFEGLPQGRYRLELTPLDGRAYSPSGLEVTPPVSGLTFVSQDLHRSRAEAVVLRVRDRSTGEALDAFAWLPRIGPFWGDAPEPEDRGDERLPFAWDLPLSLVVAAPGYRPAWIQDLAGLRDGDDPLLVVDLEPGWGAALLLFDVGRLMGGSQACLDDILAMPAVSGARVRSGGRVVGTSDVNGLALCASDGPIERFEVTLPGWSVVTVQRFAGHERTPDGIGFVLMIQD